MTQWLKVPRTGATRTLTRIARIHWHTYINTVTTTLCEAPAQQFITFQCMLSLFVFWDVRVRSVYSNESQRLRMSEFGLYTKT